MSYISDIFQDDLAEFDKHPGERSLEKETTDKFGIKHKISAKKTKNSKVVANVAQGTKKGVTYSGSTAIATSSRELQDYYLIFSQVLGCERKILKAQ